MIGFKFIEIIKRHKKNWVKYRNSQTKCNETDIDSYSSTDNLHDSGLCENDWSDIANENIFIAQQEEI